MNPTTPTSTPWGGWFRQNKRVRWTQLVSGDSYAEAWERLLDALAMTRGGESLVTMANPNCDAARLTPLTMGNQRERPR
ncbi:MAG TPA: hypothetical protein VN688_02140 [Gemmataceae bacterium]|nr:hypothetical protein [Gemmataceae bacterium]